jgi:hypothetical protein
MNFQLIHKSTHRTLINLTGEYCSVYGNFSPLVRITIEFTKKFTNGLIHECPYNPIKKIGVENFPANGLLNKALGVFADGLRLQRGEYIAAYNSKDRNGITIFYFKAFVTLSQKRLKKN